MSQHLSLQVREQLFQAGKKYQALNLEQRTKVRTLRQEYKHTMVREREHYYLERAEATSYPENKISVIIDGASQE